MFANSLLTFVTGVVQAYPVPTNTASIAFHAVGGDVAMMSVHSGDEWTIKQGEKEAINTREVSNKIMYFSGSTGTTLQIRRLTGLLS